MNQHTDRVASLLEFLHATASDTDDADDDVIDRILEDLDAMLDIANLDALARVFHKVEPTSTPHLDECNDLLENADVTLISTMALSTLIRFTCSKKSLLPAWRPLADRIAAELQTREPERWRAILHGIIQP